MTMQPLVLTFIVLAAGLVAGPNAARAEICDSPLFSAPPCCHAGNLPPFPPLPPDPNGNRFAELPPLEEELWLHGGAHLYLPEGDAAYFAHHRRLNGRRAKCDESHGELLRLPEDWCSPQPFTLFADYQGADPIRNWPCLRWLGPCGYQWEPRFVAYGGYSLLGFAHEENNERYDGVGHQALVDFDLQLTGTERFHVQYRPVGKKATGASVYLLSDPQGYVDNSTAVPDRYWFEGELSSIFSSWCCDQFTARDWNLAVGVLPFALHNQVLMNDDVAGIVLSKNTIFFGPTSNINWQTFYFFDNVDAFTDGSSHVVGTNAQIDYQRMFFEVTYAFRTHQRIDERNAHFLALSGTKFFGPWSIAARAMFKVGDENGTVDGQLVVFETNHTRIYTNSVTRHLGIHHGTYYINAFYAANGWEPISGGGFDRLRAAFAVNPLIAIARGVLGDTAGVAAGIQLFPADENQSLTPELAYESPTGTAVWGAGLRYQRKTSARSFLDFQGLVNWSDDPARRRDGLFLAHTWLF